MQIGFWGFLLRTGTNALLIQVGGSPGGWEMLGTENGSLPIGGGQAELQYYQVFGSCVFLFVERGY